MIVEFFLGSIIYFIEIGLGFLPEFTGLPSGMATAVEFIGRSLQTISEWLPVDTLIQYFLYVVYIESGIQLFRFLTWVFHWNQATEKK